MALKNWAAHVWADIWGPIWAADVALLPPLGDKYTLTPMYTAEFSFTTLGPAYQLREVCDG